MDICYKNHDEIYLLQTKHPGTERPSHRFVEMHRHDSEKENYTCTSMSPTTQISPDGYI